jgi:hypothetical protein
MMSRLLVLTALVAGACAGFGGKRGAVDAAEAEAGVKAEARRGTLAALPSAPGAHIEKIKQLGANEWLELGSPAPDPKWGRARGRAWGGRAFALAPEIRGAYFTGEGGHAMVKPDGYGMDDYWVYDINAHRWICIYPGTNTKTLNQQVKSGDLKVNDLGVVVDRDGRIVVGHRLIHAWGFLAYDTDRKKLVILKFDSGFTGTYFFPGAGRKDNGVAEAVKALAKQREGRTFPPVTPLSYDTATGRFECFPAANACPAAHGFAEILYLSAIKQFLVVGGRAGNGRMTALYDPEKKSWSVVKTQGQAPSGCEMASCYDSKRNRVYMGKTMAVRGEGEKNPLLVYDVKTSTWSEAAIDKGNGPLNWSYARVSLHYDSANDAVVAIHYADEKIYVYDPEADAWREPVAMRAGVKTKGKCGHAFYDPELNAHFVFTAGDSADNGIMWAYRWGKGGDAK